MTIRTNFSIALAVATVLSVSSATGCSKTPLAGTLAEVGPPAIGSAIADGSAVGEKLQRAVARVIAPSGGEGSSQAPPARTTIRNLKSGDEAASARHGVAVREVDIEHSRLVAHDVSYELENVGDRRLRSVTLSITHFGDDGEPVHEAEVTRHFFETGFAAGDTRLGHFWGTDVPDSWDEETVEVEVESVTPFRRR